MGNPARDLADLLDSWHASGQTTIFQTRRVALGLEDSGLSVEFWRGYVRQLQKVLAYEAAVDQLEASGSGSIEAYRLHLPAIYGALVAPDAAWNNGANASMSNVEPAVIANLRLAAEAMEVRGFSALGDVEVEQIRTTLREALQQTNDLPASSDREHLIWIIEEAIRFADGADRFGQETVRDTTARVVVVMGDYIESQTVAPERSSILSRLRDELIVSLIGQAGANALLAGITTSAPLVIKALGG